MSIDESPSRIEPCLLDEAPVAIVDLVAKLSAEARILGSRLHPRTAVALADTVRIMNCYYSNLIEGHNTTPREIERAMEDRLDAEPERRDLQIEARAHIRVQRGIDVGHTLGRQLEPASPDYIAGLHREFYRNAADSMLLIRHDGQDVRMKPGVFRSAADHDVRVGRHWPPSGQVVDAFMARFAERYRFATLGTGSRIMAIAAAHHRFNYIHPFLDGNGRVSRLMSHAMALEAGIGAHGLWSVSRGLARGLTGPGDYKRMMDHADMPRQGDLDGRGNLSRRALVDFTTWFLQVCLDQVTFMGGLFALDTLSDRFKRYVAQRDMRSEAVVLLNQVFQRGELARGEVSAVTGLKERAARDLLGTLVRDGILGSDTPKGPVSLRFPLDAIETLFPALFPRT